MGPGEIFAPARNFKPTSDPFRISDCLISIIGRIKRLRVFLAIGTLPIPQAVAEPPHHGELHSLEPLQHRLPLFKRQIYGQQQSCLCEPLGNAGISISMSLRRRQAVLTRRALPDFAEPYL